MNKRPIQKADINNGESNDQTSGFNDVISYIVISSISSYV